MTIANVWKHPACAIAEKFLSLTMATGAAFAVLYFVKSVNQKTMRHVSVAVNNWRLYEIPKTIGC